MVAMAEVHTILEQSPTAVFQTAMGGGVLATAMGWLPQAMGLVAATIGAVYYTIVIWESKTVQHYIANKRMVRRAKKVARLRAREKIITAELEALEVVRVAKRTAAAKVEDANAEAIKLVAQEDTEVEIKHAQPRPDPLKVLGPPRS